MIFTDLKLFPSYKESESHTRHCFKCIPLLKGTSSSCLNASFCLSLFDHGPYHETMPGKSVGSKSETPESELGLPAKVTPT